jgi:hypothetical protein
MSNAIQQHIASDLSKGKGKGSVVCVDIIKAFGGSGGIVWLTINVGIRWRSVVSLMPWSLYPYGKSLHYPLNRRLGRPVSQSGCFGEDKNLLLL